jgi:MFS family permease
MAAGLALFTQAPVHGSYVQHVLPVLILLGLGAGSSFAALMTLAMSGATREDAGLASGLVNTSAQVGGALGLAVLATLSATRTHDLTAAGKTTASALTSGYHLAFLIGAVLLVVSAIIGATVLESAEAPAAHAASDAEGSAEEAALREAA